MGTAAERDDLFGGIERRGGGRGVDFEWMLWEGDGGSYFLFFIFSVVGGGAGGMLRSNQAVGIFYMFSLRN